MKKMSSQRNDGWSDQSYDFGHGEDFNQQVGHILNEACHVFYYHSSGNWASVHKENYARQLAQFIRRYPSLIGQLKQLDDRVVKMVVYRAVEIIGNEQA